MTQDEKVKEIAAEKWRIEFEGWNNYGDNRYYVAQAAYFAACLKRQEEIFLLESQKEELENSFNRIALDLVEAKRNHTLELGERLKAEAKIKELTEGIEKFIESTRGWYIPQLPNRHWEAINKLKKLVEKK